MDRQPPDGGVCRTVQEWISSSAPQWIRDAARDLSSQGSMGFLPSVPSCSVSYDLTKPSHHNSSRSDEGSVVTRGGTCQSEAIPKASVLFEAASNIALTQCDVSSKPSRSSEAEPPPCWAQDGCSPPVISWIVCCQNGNHVAYEHGNQARPLRPNTSALRHSVNHAGGIRSRRCDSAPNSSCGR